MKEPNYTLLCDYYELTMGNGYFEAEKRVWALQYFRDGKMESGQDLVL